MTLQVHGKQPVNELAAIPFDIDDNLVLII
jgi:hypothetical protein